VLRRKQNDLSFCFLGVSGGRRKGKGRKKRGRRGEEKGRRDEERGKRKGRRGYLT